MRKMITRKIVTVSTFNASDLLINNCRDVPGLSQTSKMKHSQ